MFASKAGAKMVIGIDMSNILDQAEKIVRSNGFTEDRKSFTPAERMECGGTPPNVASSAVEGREECSGSL